MSTSDARLRTPPMERFAGTEHNIDLATALEELRREPHEAKDSHRQITVFHKGALRVMLFAFAPGGRLPEHRAPGYVIIHALRGTIRVRTSSTVHELSAGQLLTLEPGLTHDVEARDEADMLLTVSLVS